MLGHYDKSELGGSAQLGPGITGASGISEDLSSFGSRVSIGIGLSVESAQEAPVFVVFPLVSS